MELHALIPVKSLHHAKSRLAKRLSQQQRQELVLSMLDHVLMILKSCDEMKKITVVTPDVEVKKHVLQLGFSVTSEEKPGHNSSLTAAAQNENSEISLLTISADLPFLTSHDVGQLIKLLTSHDIALAPSKDNGTNAIIVKKTLLLPYLFGKNSFEKYKEVAIKKNLSYAVYESQTIAFDVDTIEDFGQLS